MGGGTIIRGGPPKGPPPSSDPSVKTSPCELNHNLPILQAFTLNPAILLPIDITRHYYYPHYQNLALEKKPEKILLNTCFLKTVH